MGLLLSWVLFGLIRHKVTLSVSAGLDLRTLKVSYPEMWSLSPTRSYGTVIQDYPAKYIPAYPRKLVVRVLEYLRLPA